MQSAPPDVDPLVIRLKLALTDEHVSDVRPSDRLSSFHRSHQDYASQADREAHKAFVGST